MSINRPMLYRRILDTLLKERNRLGFDLPLMICLLKKTIFNDPANNCIIKGKRSDAIDTLSEYIDRVDDMGKKLTDNTEQAEMNKAKKVLKDQLQNLLMGGIK